MLWQLSSVFGIILRNRTKQGQITLNGCAVLYVSHDFLPFNIAWLQKQSHLLLWCSEDLSQIMGSHYCNACFWRDLMWIVNVVMLYTAVQPVLLRHILVSYESFMWRTNIDPAWTVKREVLLYLREKAY